jgi:hypothetical protein
MSNRVRPNAVRITIEYDDGEVREARGGDADAITRHLDACEAMARRQGMRYDGPPLRVVRPAAWAAGPG